MKHVRILFGYAFAIAGLSIAWFVPLLWLLTPNPTLSLEPRVAAVAPRVAKSIEPKPTSPIVRQELLAPATEEPAALSEMSEAPAALPKKPAAHLKKHDSGARPVERLAKKHALSARHPSRNQPLVTRNAREFVPRTAPVTTARTDFPY